MNELRNPNRLIHEKSPYLLQHAYNPVDWYPWGEKAFAKADADGSSVRKQKMVPRLFLVSSSLTSPGFCVASSGTTANDRPIRMISSINNAPSGKDLNIQDSSMPNILSWELQRKDEENADLKEELAIVKKAVHIFSKERN